VTLSEKKEACQGALPRQNPGSYDREERGAAKTLETAGQGNCAVPAERCKKCASTDTFVEEEGSRGGVVKTNSVGVGSLECSGGKRMGDAK